MKNEERPYYVQAIPVPETPGPASIQVAGRRRKWWEAPAPLLTPNERVSVPLFIPRIPLPTCFMEPSFDLPMPMPGSEHRYAKAEKMAGVRAVITGAHPVSPSIGPTRKR